MKGIIVKSVLMVCIAVGMANYAVYVMTGKTPITIEDIAMPSFDFNANNPLSAPTRAYTWTDEKGVVHFSEELPPANAHLEVSSMVVDPSAMTTMEPPPDIPAFDKTGPTAASRKPLKVNTADFLPTPGNVKKLVEDAKNVQHLVDERQQQLERAIGD